MPGYKPIVMVSSSIAGRWVTDSMMTLTCWSVPDGCLRLDPSWLNCVFSLALEVSDLRVLFIVSSQFVYWFGCFHVKIHCIS